MTSIVILNGPIIQANEAVSDGIDCSAGRLVRITMPEEWSDADLSFLISSNGEWYNDLYFANGAEYLVQAAAKRAIIIPQQDWIPGLWIKLRSGTSMQPRPQPKYSEFSMVLLVEEPTAPALEMNGRSIEDRIKAAGRHP